MANKMWDGQAESVAMGLKQKTYPNATPSRPFSFNVGKFDCQHETKQSLPVNNNQRKRITTNTGTYKNGGAMQFVPKTVWVPSTS